MPTLKDVARETGVTVSTVSRVLNNRGYISEETRNKVYAAMRKLNYQPNEVARALSKQTSNTIGVIVPHIQHPYFAELISHLENQAYKRKHKLLLFNSQSKDEKEWEYLEMCAASRVAGIILCSGNIGVEKFRGLNVPLITMERSLENGTASVECDNHYGGRLAAEHLIDCGCRHLAYISGANSNIMPADERGAGFSEVCRERGLEYYVAYTDQKQFESLEYHVILEKLLEDHPETDGIFTSGDLIAAQLLQLCHRLGRRVPEGIKIVGFDDVELASLTIPTITTIRQPLKEMAGLAVELLIKAGSGRLVPRRSTLPVTLMKRGSTGAAYS